MFVTVHPSSLLRAPDEAERRSAYAKFVEDMRAVERLVSAVISRSRVRAGK